MPHSKSQAPPPVILVVEDDEDLLKAIAFSFDTEGYEVRAFLTGETLLEAGPLPARGCLVIDHLLPGADGLEVLAELRVRGVALPAVLITTPNSTIVARALKVGTPVVEKPLMERLLIDEVERQLALSWPAPRET